MVVEDEGDGATRGSCGCGDGCIEASRPIELHVRLPVAPDMARDAATACIGVITGEEGCVGLLARPIVAISTAWHATHGLELQLWRRRAQDAAVVLIIAEPTACGRSTTPAVEPHHGITRSGRESRGVAVSNQEGIGVPYFEVDFFCR